MRGIPPSPKRLGKSSQKRIPNAQFPTQGALARRSRAEYGEGMNGSLAVQSDFISIADYLAGEEEAAERHEYFDGQVLAMAGASEAHEIVAGNLFALLLAHIRGRGCRVFKGDMKVQLQLHQKDLFYYPDIMVVCDSSDREPLYKTKPKVLVEVMSDYNKDHVEKLFAYQQIETLEDYLIIDQNAKQAEAWIYRRAGGWNKEEGVRDGRIYLPSLGFETDLMPLYEME